MPCLRAFARLPQGRRLQLWPVLCGPRVLHGGLVQERYFRCPRRNGPGLWRKLPVLLLQQGLPFRHGEPGAVCGTGADRPSPPLPGARARPPRRRPQRWPRTPPTRHHPPSPPPRLQDCASGICGPGAKCAAPSHCGFEPSPTDLAEDQHYNAKHHNTKPRPRCGRCVCQPCLLGQPCEQAGDCAGGLACGSSGRCEVSPVA